VASQVFIPLTVGGGVRTVEDVRRLLNAGADKTSFNSAAIANPQVIARRVRQVRRAVHRGGDRRQAPQRRGSRHPRPGLGRLQPRRAQEHRPGRRRLGHRDGARGAGEILLTSMDRDGTKSGFDLALTRAVSDAVSVPVIASGGVGNLEHLADGIQTGGADAVLAASIFHYGEYTVGRPRQRMAERAASRSSAARQAAYGVSHAFLAPQLCFCVANRLFCKSRQYAHGLVRRSQMGRKGLVPVIAQEASSGDVLMFAWMDREALQKTAELGRAVYFSRSRGQAVVQGRGVRPRAEGARDPPGLRQRRGAAQGDAARPRPSASPATPAATAAFSSCTKTGLGWSSRS
jgi:cyclase